MATKKLNLMMIYDTLILVNFQPNILLKIPVRIFPMFYQFQGRLRICLIRKVS